MELLSTVAAISTPYGSGGISIIRISGQDAVNIADKVFKSSSGKLLCDVPSHTIHFGHILSEDKRKIDEVLVSVMRAPRTFTGEDTVEINCHGGLLVTKLVLERVLSAGAVSASRGEFTKRAFLNGKMDLAKAESVIDVITSKTNLEHQISVNNLGGALSEKINEIRGAIVMLMANIQVLIDYPDEGLEPMSDDEFLAEIKRIHKEVEKLYNSSFAGMVLKSGVKTAIVGKPNVGKSSLLNLLSGEEKAIVTDIEGTTRDAIEEDVVLGDVVLSLADTAGIRETDDAVEKLGVRRSEEYIQTSNLIIFMLDASSGLDKRDEEIINSLSGKKVIALINKTDKAKADFKQQIKDRFDICIEFSVKEKTGIDELKKAVENLFETGKIASDGASVITNARHRDALFKAKSALENAISAIAASISVDTTFIDLTEAAESLGEIVGLSVSEEVVDAIFHKFCIGK